MLLIRWLFVFHLLLLAQAPDALANPCSTFFSTKNQRGAVAASHSIISTSQLVAEPGSVAANNPAIKDKLIQLDQMLHDTTVEISASIKSGKKFSEGFTKLTQLRAKVSHELDALAVEHASSVKFSHELKFSAEKIRLVTHSHNSKGVAWMDKIAMDMQKSLHGDSIYALNSDVRGELGELMAAAHLDFDFRGIQVRNLNFISNVDQVVLNNSFKEMGYDLSLLDKEIDAVLGEKNQIWVEAKNLRNIEIHRLFHQLEKNIQLIVLLRNGISLNPSGGHPIVQHRFEELRYVFFQGLSDLDAIELQKEAERVQRDLGVAPSEFIQLIVLSVK